MIDENHTKTTLTWNSAIPGLWKYSNFLKHTVNLFLFLLAPFQLWETWVTFMFVCPALLKEWCAVTFLPKLEMDTRSYDEVHHCSCWISTSSPCHCLQVSINQILTHGIFLLNPSCMYVRRVVETCLQTLSMDYVITRAIKVHCKRV